MSQDLLSIEVFRSWIGTGERGLSSETIVEHLTGFPIKGRRHLGRADHPYDPADFRRCYLLLQQVPLAAERFDRMRTASPTWARLVDAWDELVALFESERDQGSAPRLYARMQEVLAR